MRRLKRTRGLFPLSWVFLLIFAKDAYAYLDPGTGSYIIQMALAVLVGGLYAVKVYWNNIKGFFSKNKDEENENK